MKYRVILSNCFTCSLIFSKVYIYTMEVGRYNTSEIIVMDQVQKYMDGPRLLRMHLSEYIPQLSTRNVDLVP